MTHVLICLSSYIKPKIFFDKYLNIRIEKLMHAKKYARISSMQSFIFIFLHVHVKIKNEVHSYCIILYMHVN